MDSPFSHLLCTNYYPQTEESAQQIRSFCSAQLNKIEDLEDEISSVRAHLDQLCHKRDTLRKSLLAHQGLLSPIRQLPPEIIHKIFSFCVGLDPPSLPLRGEIEGNSFDCDNAPLLLCRVCSDWRTLVLNTSELWSSLRIAPSRSEDLRQNRKPDWVCGAVETFLERSGEYPLSLWISMTGQWDLLLSRQLLRMLALHSHRWRSLYLTVPAKAYDVWNSFTISDLPCLQSVHFGKRSARGNIDGTMPHTPSFMLCAPALRHVSLPHSEFDTTGIPWGQLTELCFDGGLVPRLTVVGVLQVLSCCANLRICTLSDNIQEDRHASSHMVKLPLLHTLRLLYVQNARTLLKNLDVPALQSFVVHDDFQKNVNGYKTDYKAFVRRSCKGLTSLSLKGGPPLHPLYEWLSECPQLQEFSLEDDRSWIPENLLSFFTPPSGQQDKKICSYPDLRRLVVKYKADLSGWEFLTFLKRRCNPDRPPGIARLESVELHLSDKSSASDSWRGMPQWTQPYIDTGVDIRITYARW